MCHMCRFNDLLRAKNSKLRLRSTKTWTAGSSNAFKKSSTSKQTRSPSPHTSCTTCHKQTSSTMDANSKRTRTLKHTLPIRFLSRTPNVSRNLPLTSSFSSNCCQSWFRIRILFQSRSKSRKLKSPTPCVWLKLPCCANISIETSRRTISTN